MIAIDNVVDIVEKSGNRYWVLSDLRNNKVGTYIFKYTPEENTGIEESIEALQEALDMLMDGKYQIRHFNSLNKESKGFASVSFTKGNGVGNRSSVGIGSAPQQHYGGIGNIGEIVAEKVELELLRHKNKELEERLDELEELNGDPTGAKNAFSFVTDAIGSVPNGKEMFGHAIASILGKFMTPGVAGVHKDTNTPNTPIVLEAEAASDVNQFLEANGQALSEVIARLYVLDTDILHTLQRMATKAESNPNLIGMLKGFI